MKTLPAMEVRNREESSNQSKKRKLDALSHLKGLGADSPRAESLDAWLVEERSGWSGRL